MNQSYISRNALCLETYCTVVNCINVIYYGTLCFLPKWFTCLQSWFSSPKTNQTEDTMIGNVSLRVLRASFLFWCVCCFFFDCLCLDLFVWVWFIFVYFLIFFPEYEECFVFWVSPYISFLSLIYQYVQLSLFSVGVVFNFLKIIFHPPPFWGVPALNFQWCTLPGTNSWWVLGKMHLVPLKYGPSFWVSMSVSGGVFSWKIPFPYGASWASVTSTKIALGVTKSVRCTVPCGRKCVERRYGWWKKSCTT